MGLFLINRQLLVRARPKISCLAVRGLETRFQFSNGRLLKLSSGRLARMADGSAVASIGDTNVMAIAVAKARTTATPNLGFVPLTVDYRQKAAAAGRIPTHHLRREIGLSEKEILTSRIIDRSLRPLFAKGFNFETQIVCNLLSIDGQNDPDILAVNAASTALALSDIPWAGPVGAIRVALDAADEVITSPTRKEMNEAKMNLVITVNELGNVLMLEAYANEPVLEQNVIKAIAKGIREAKVIINNIKQLQKEIGRPKRNVEAVQFPVKAHVEAIKTMAAGQIRDVFSNHAHDKISRDEALTEIRLRVLEALKEEFPEDTNLLPETFSLVCKQVYAELVLKTGVRADGRSITELRPISCEVDLFRPLHGSALFQRGQTQVMCTTTLDSLDSSWRADAITSITQGFKEKNFMLHYEFPQYATNDLSRGSNVGRREIGHGALAERAIRPVVPDGQNFTIRLLCEVLESNGSSSMASVCAGSLALMDAGVEISSPLAGVAIGLIKQPEDSAEASEKDEDQFRILTDINGMEDYFGEMDFKIAGTRKAFTALQLDCKLTDGLPPKLLYEAIQRSNAARSHILNIMGEVIDEPRQKAKETMPVSERIVVPLGKRSSLLGVGWSNMKRLMNTTGVHVSQDLDEANAFQVFAPNQEAMNEAKEWIQSTLEKPNIPELEFGAIYEAKVVEVRENGVMVQLAQGLQPTFVHNNQLDPRKVAHPSALGLEEGSLIRVKYFGRDPVSGQMRVSRKVLMLTESQVKDLVR